MEKIKKFLREGTEGLFLLLIAVVILNVIPVGSKTAESKNKQTSVSEEQVANDEQILGETSENSEKAEEAADETVPEIPKETAENSKKETVVAQNTQEETVTETAVDDIDPKDALYDELKTNLKKYCDKKFDTKKCRKYLLEAKDAGEKGRRFRDLYKKYHFEPKKDNNSNNNSDSADPNVAISLVITAGGSSKSYNVISSPSASVVDLMELAGVTYNRKGNICAGCMNNINEMGENSATMSWMLYICKKDTCKLAPVGDSDCRINGCTEERVKDWDKAEWKYLDWTTVDWTKIW